MAIPHARQRERLVEMWRQHHLEAAAETTAAGAPEPPTAIVFGDFAFTMGFRRIAFNACPSACSLPGFTRRRLVPGNNCADATVAANLKTGLLRVKKIGLPPFTSGVRDADPVLARKQALFWHQFFGPEENRSNTVDVVKLKAVCLTGQKWQV